jgi:hypothetical protein
MSTVERTPYVAVGNSEVNERDFLDYEFYVITSAVSYYRQKTEMNDRFETCVSAT